MTADVGNGPILPLLRDIKPRVTDPTSRPSVYTNIRPLTILHIARVTMKSARPNLVINKPLHSPMTSPAPRPTTTAGINISGLPCITDAHKTPAIVATELTDRSIPKDRIAMVCPMLTIPRADAWRNTLVILRPVRNSGAIVAVIALITKSKRIMGISACLDRVRAMSSCCILSFKDANFGSKLSLLQLLLNRELGAKYSVCKYVRIAIRQLRQPLPFLL